MAYVLTLQPTFTQGFVLGQLSILVLLFLVLKYLFLDSATEPAARRSFQSIPRSKRVTEILENIDEDNLIRHEESLETFPASLSDGKESTEWFNVIIKEIFNSYRAELRDNVRGSAGDDVARERIERYLNNHRGTNLIDPIFVDAVSLGHSAPRLYDARVLPKDAGEFMGNRHRIRIEATYTDTISLDLTTSLFFNQPVPAFARLPVSLSLSLNLLRATIIIIPPLPDDTEPVLTIQLQPGVELSLQTKSLLGSRTVLADVPKIHELIEARIKRALVERGTWRIHLPMRKQ
ncbi:ERMES complex subunit mmm1 [Serendipita sp. 411]|nr:ERMES complex subunit mmm1 [Serendipita sp. 411]